MRTAGAGEAGPQGDRAVERPGGEPVQAATGATKVTLWGPGEGGPGPDHTRLVSHVRSYMYTQMHTDAHVCFNSKTNQTRTLPDTVL